MFAGDRIHRSIVFLLAASGLLFAGGIALLAYRLPADVQPHAAAVVFISFAFLAPAITLAIVNYRVALAALLATAVLVVELGFYLKAVRGMSAALPADCPLGLCWAPTSPAQREIFGFAEFVTALALLVVVYTVTDVRYRFRIAIAPIPLYWLTFIFLVIIGLGTLLSDLWFAEGWPTPLLFRDQLLWQSAFGFLFLLVVMGWLWFAFIRPPVFGKRNFRPFTHALYRYILRGSDAELPAIADELTRSARSIVGLSKEPDSWRVPANEAQEGEAVEPAKEPDASDYAHDLLLLLGNRKFCRAIAASSPSTAIAFFQETAAAEKFHIPLGTFASNLVTEALLNKDSILYHEDEGYYSGLIGYIRPFSRAVFGNFQLVEALASEGNSPLDVNLGLRFSWDAAQLKAYCRALLLTLDSYFETRSWYQHSYAIHRSLNTVEHSSGDLYKLNNQESVLGDSFDRLYAVVDFVKDAVEHADQHPAIPISVRRRGDARPWREGFLDNIAELMFKVIFNASAVRAPVDTAWTIQHNTVWSSFFDLGKDTRARKIVLFKLRRLLFDEVRRMEEFPNYKSARILGLCLNVMGLKVGDKKGYGSEEYPLRRAVLNWTKRHYLRLTEVQPDVAAACLVGGITFDVENSRLVKTYIKGLNLEAPKVYLDLERFASVEQAPGKPA